MEYNQETQPKKEIDDLDIIKVNKNMVDIVQGIVAKEPNIPQELRKIIYTLIYVVENDMNIRCMDKNYGKLNFSILDQKQKITTKYYFIREKHNDILKLSLGYQLNNQYYGSCAFVIEGGRHQLKLKEYVSFKKNGELSLEGIENNHSFKQIEDLTFNILNDNSWTTITKDSGTVIFNAFNTYFLSEEVLSEEEIEKIRKREQEEAEKRKRNEIIIHEELWQSFTDLDLESEKSKERFSGMCQDMEKKMEQHITSDSESEEEQEKWFDQDKETEERINSYSITDAKSEKSLKINGKQGEVSKEIQKWSIEESDEDSDPSLGEVNQRIKKAIKSLKKNTNENHEEQWKKSVEDPAEKPTKKPAENPTKKPAENPTKKPAKEPKKTAEKPKKPAEKPKKPAEKPEEPAEESKTITITITIVVIVGVGAGSAYIYYIKIIKTQDNIKIELTTIKKKKKEKKEK